MNSDVDELNGDKDDDCFQNLNWNKSIYIHVSSSLLDNCLLVGFFVGG